MLFKGGALYMYCRLKGHAFYETLLCRIHIVILRSKNFMVVLLSQCYHSYQWNFNSAIFDIYL